MDFVAHIGDIVLLENDEQYIVLNQIDFENDPYLLVCETPDVNEVFDEGSNNPLEYRFVKEVVREGKYMVVPVNDKATVANLFTKLEKEIKG